MSVTENATDGFWTAFCLSHLSCCDQIHDRKRLREEIFMLTHGFRELSPWLFGTMCLGSTLWKWVSGGSLPHPGQKQRGKGQGQMLSRTQPSPTSSNFQNRPSYQWEPVGDIPYSGYNISMCIIHCKLANNPFSFSKATETYARMLWNWLVTSEVPLAAPGGLDSQVWGVCDPQTAQTWRSHSNCQRACIHTIGKW